MGKQSEVIVPSGTSMGKQLSWDLGNAQGRTSTPAALAHISTIPFRVTAFVVTALKICPPAASHPTAAAIIVATSSQWATTESCACEKKGSVPSVS
jgi:hypothetical protein